MQNRGDGVDRREENARRRNAAHLPVGRRERPIRNALVRKQQFILRRGGVRRAQRVSGEQALAVAAGAGGGRRAAGGGVECVVGVDVGVGVRVCDGALGSGAPAVALRVSIQSV